MKRALKFRVWSIETGMYALTESCGMKELPVAGYVDPGRIEMNNQGELYDIYGKDDLLVIEQFTGLHDSKGCEIYEGDIVRCEIYGDLHWGAVVYDLPYFKAEDKVRLAEAGNSVWIPLCVHVPVEVIGNIHENPELLKP